MRVRLTGSVLPPWAVQDSSGVITHIELHPSDAEILNGFQGNMPAEYKLLFPPLAIYVALDKVDIEFIPPTVCPSHQVTGFDGVCPECQSHPGLVQVCPQKKKWHYTDTESGYATSVERTQLPIMPEKACPLYGLQGTTTDPGLIGHFAMPRRLDTDIKWLIVYVMLSRVRSLDRLASFGIDNKIREIMESGPPETLVGNFDKLFLEKAKRTRVAARQARRALGWPPADTSA